MATTLAILFHSPVTGEINCEEHAPARVTNSWWRDRWCRVTPRYRATWPTAELGEMRCEVCRANERRERERCVESPTPSTKG